MIVYCPYQPEGGAAIHMSKRVISLFFALTMTIASLAGCAKENAGDISENTSSAITSEGSDTMSSQHEQSHKPAVLPEFPDYTDGASNFMADFIGIGHIQPGYGFGDKNVLVEGAERIRSLGSKTIKLYISPNYKDYYRPNTTWDTYTSPVELAQSEPFREVFTMDFNTYILGAYTFHPQYATYWLNGLTEEQKQKEYDDMYALAMHLLTTYAGTGKTFIFQNWESDWSCMPKSDAAYDPPQEVFDRLTQWINIRQDAVNDARRDSGAEDVYLFNCLEVNLVKKAQEGKPTVTNNVIPTTNRNSYNHTLKPPS